MKQIISGTGQLMDLKVWQTFRGLKGDKISANFNWQEFDCEDELLLSEILIDFLQYVRVKWGKPLKINSGYRSKEKQQQLKEQGYKTATFSPHTKGMAADLDTVSASETKHLVSMIQLCAKNLKLNVRIGYQQYLNAGQTFVHIDVCPEYYAKGKPYHDHVHPPAYENVITW